MANHRGSSIEKILPVNLSVSGDGAEATSGVKTGNLSPILASDYSLVSKG